MTFRELILATGALLGLEEFQPDEEGFCTLESEDGAITIAYIPEAYEMILVRAVVGEVPAEASGTVLHRALEANSGLRETDEATLSVNPDTGCFELARFLPLEGQEPKALLEVIEGFAATLVEVRGRLLEGGEAEPLEPGQSEEAAPASPPEDFRDLDARGFLRV